jgi:hypothetical protein
MPSKKAAKKQAQPEKLKFNINLPVERYKTADFFDGQVKITMWCYYSGEVSYTSGALRRAIRDVPPPNPDLDMPDTDALAKMSEDEQASWAAKLEKFDPLRSHFDAFATIIPYLVDIEFNIANPEEVEEDLYYLYDWWVNSNAKKLLKARSYEALWQSFLQYVMGRMVGVLTAAFYMTRRDKAPASAGVTVGATKKGEGDPSFLADGSPTSQSSSST